MESLQTRITVAQDDQFIVTIALEVDAEGRADVLGAVGLTLSWHGGEAKIAGDGAILKETGWIHLHAHSVTGAEKEVQVMVTVHVEESAAIAIARHLIRPDIPQRLSAIMIGDRLDKPSLELNAILVSRAIEATAEMATLVSRAIPVD